MKRILIYFLLTSLFSVAFADFFHYQFHKHEFLSASAPEATNANSIPLEDNCDFLKATGSFSKLKVFAPDVLFELASNIVVSVVIFLPNTNIPLQEIDSIVRARGPPVYSLFNI